jgi:hypothetical protein
MTQHQVDDPPTFYSNENNEKKRKFMTNNNIHLQLFYYLPNKIVGGA